MLKHFSLLAGATVLLCFARKRHGDHSNGASVQGQPPSIAVDLDAATNVTGVTGPCLCCGTTVLFLVSEGAVNVANTGRR